MKVNLLQPVVQVGFETDLVHRAILTAYSFSNKSAHFIYTNNFFKNLVTKLIKIIQIVLMYFYLSKLYLFLYYIGLKASRISRLAQFYLINRLPVTAGFS